MTDITLVDSTELRFGIRPNYQIPRKGYLVNIEVILEYDENMKNKLKDNFESCVIRRAEFSVQGMQIDVVYGFDINIYNKQYNQKKKNIVLPFFFCRGDNYSLDTNKIDEFIDIRVAIDFGDSNEVFKDNTQIPFAYKIICHYEDTETRNPDLKKYNDCILLCECKYICQRLLDGNSKCHICRSKELNRNVHYKIGNDITQMQTDGEQGLYISSNALESINSDCIHSKYRLNFNQNISEIYLGFYVSNAHTEKCFDFIDIIDNINFMVNGCDLDVFETNIKLECRKFTEVNNNLYLCSFNEKINFTTMDNISLCFRLNKDNLLKYKEQLSNIIFRCSAKSDNKLMYDRAICMLKFS